MRKQRISQALEVSRIVLRVGLTSNGFTDRT